MRLVFLVLVLVVLAMARPYIDIDELEKYFRRDSLRLQADGTGEYTGGPSMEALIRHYGPVRYRKKPATTAYVVDIHEFSGSG
ncbi:hypothetical protein QR680_013631 [Steinernema hermaphroditum]|uniref:Uncharacterized protein n=1 Tax=Steinernema hermaphroditum TaxID=289476 RepID=A0AA39M2V5_9BILA|nr:hypothetical protein QR680_013631 [Steinernema hermaphroditum]